MVLGDVCFPSLGRRTRAHAADISHSLPVNAYLNRWIVLRAYYHELSSQVTNSPDKNKQSKVQCMNNPPLVMNVYLLMGNYCGLVFACLCFVLPAYCFIWSLNPLLPTVCFHKNLERRCSRSHSSTVNITIKIETIPCCFLSCKEK